LQEVKEIWDEISNLKRVMAMSYSGDRVSQEVEALRQKFERCGQGHVFRYWDSLSAESRQRFFQQLQEIDLELVDHLVQTYLQDPERRKFKGHLEPAPYIPLPQTKEEKKRHEEARKVGEDVLQSGRVGTVLVAGGQATRLDYDLPKGCYPITPVREKSIFQLHAEKIRALQRRYGIEIPWYIMTSETTDVATREFFRQQNYFGLKPDQVFFFTQRMIPAVDEQGKLILDAPDHVFTSPNGHGGTLLALQESGALADMRRRGIEELFYFQVDNVLVKICDPVFIGYHVQAGAEMSSKVVIKRDPFEKVGIIAYIDGKLGVVEYSDLTEEQMQARNPDGTLKFRAGSIAIHMIRVDFVEKEMEGGFRLPYHVAHKKIPYLDENGQLVQPKEPNGYKFETFIFDALRDTTRSVVLEVSREEEFSPVKNRSGEDSPETARRDMANLYGRWLEKAGISVPRTPSGDVAVPIEISPLYALDEEELIRKVDSSLVIKDALYLGD